MNKILLLLIVFLGLSSVGNAEETAVANITNINYSDHIGNDILIDINGNNLEECSELYINDLKYTIKSKTNEKIQYDFSDKQKYSGKVTLKCGINNSTFIYYSFPHIKSLSKFEKDLNIEIIGENFGDNSEVNIEGGTFIKDIVQNKIILGKIPDTITSNEIFVTKGGLKSNIVKYDLKIPKIKYILSDNGFKNNTKIQVVGENLNSYYKSKLLINNVENTDISYLSNGNIELTLDKHLGDKNIRIESEGIKSNSVVVNSKGEQPVINKIYSKKIKNTYDNLIDVIEIHGKDFGLYTDTTIVYNGSNALQIYKSNSNTITAYRNFDIDDEYGIHIEINGVKSNEYFLGYKSGIPSIESIELDGSEGNNRSVKLHVNNFNNKRDKIYLNGTVIAPLFCSSIICKLNISKDIIKGEFSVGNGKYTNLVKRKFDISYNNLPYISYLKFRSQLKKGTNFELLGQNFLGASIEITNLVGKKDNGKLDIKVSDGSIKGSISSDYDIAADSSIKITKLGTTYSIGFVGEKLSKLNIEGFAFINNYTLDKKYKFITEGAKINVSGKGLNNKIYVLFGDKKIQFHSLSDNVGYFNVPVGVSEGITNFSLVNINGNRGNSKDILVLDKTNDGNVIINSTIIDDKLFELHKDYNNTSLYNIGIINPIDDYVLKNIEFNIGKYNKNMYLGTFKLVWDGKILAETEVDDYGKIIFTGNFPLNQTLTSNKITLNKKSNFIFPGNISISLNEKKLKIINKDGAQIKNINFSGIKSSSIYIKELTILKCEDSEDDDVNCIKLNKPEVKEEVKKEEVKVDNNQNSEVKKLTKAEKVYLRIDDISNNLFGKYSKMSLFNQLNKYKDLRFKIEKIVKKKQHSPSKIFLEYFYDKIDQKYKSIFKQYILLKK